MKRKTSQRAAIEQVFCQLDRPLGIEEILETGRMAVESLNQATVYRNVKLLLENGWLKQVCHPSLGTLYERTGKGHHHHFHCRVCNRAFFNDFLMAESGLTLCGGYGYRLFR